MQPIAKYPRAHLLGIPTEVRLNIWRHIYHEILTGKENQWHERPVTSWRGLAGTSRTIYHEVAEFWPRTMVPYHKNDTSSRAQSITTNLTRGLTISLFQAFRQLSIQLPIQQTNEPELYFRQVAAGLLRLAPVLEDLRIFFVGKDALGASTNYMGCGIRSYLNSPESSRLTLRKEGSCYLERNVLFRSIKNLYLLSNLVISNANYPLLQSLIGHKPDLQTLMLVTDSRTELFKHYGGPLINWQPSAALHTLLISTNAVLGAANMILKAMNNLRDLTLLVPSDEWQSNNWQWLEHTAIIFRYMTTHGNNLRRFRLCMEQPLNENIAGHLLGAIKLYLPRTKLQVLEIHMNLDSDYFGQELVEALPKSLKRLYVSEELVGPEDLVKAVKARYFGDKDRGGHLKAGQLGFVGYEYWEREESRLELLQMNGALLDRERNAHLIDHPEDYSFRFGGGSVPCAKGTLTAPTVKQIREDMMSLEEVPDEALRYYEDQTAWQITEMEMAFFAEEPAKVEDQFAYLAMPVNLEVGEHDHWMSL
jgi:hypothetical protein